MKSHCLGIWFGLISFAFGIDIRENTINREARAGFISFKPVGEGIGLGLDIILPFVKVPLNRQEHGDDTALLNINTAAILMSSLIGGGGILISHLFKSLGYMGVEDSEEKDDLKSEPRKKRQDTSNFSSMIPDLIDNFKLVHRSESGEKIVTSFPQLFDRIEETFLENNINLVSCLQKALCISIAQAQQRVRDRQATGSEKILEVLSELKWITDSLQSTSWATAIETGRLHNINYCNQKFTQCEWAQPVQKFRQLLDTYVRFV